MSLIRENLVHLENLFACKIEFDDASVAISIGNEEVAVLQSRNRCWFAEELRRSSGLERLAESQFGLGGRVPYVEAENLMKPDVSHVVIIAVYVQA